MEHLINISVNNNTVGIPASANGVMGIFAKAVAVGSTFLLDTPYLLTKLADLTPLGINSAYDTTNGVAVYQQISEFYTEAGDGALCWLFGVATGTAYATYVAGSTFDTLIRFTDQDDPLNRVKMIGLCYEVPTVQQVSADFPIDVTNTQTALQTKQQQLFNQGYQFSAIIDGYKMSSTVTPSSLATQATKADFSLSLCITGNLPNGVSAVGQALGRFARISIGQGFGAVEDGPVSSVAAYLTNGATIQPTGALVVGKVYTVKGGSITYNSLPVLDGVSFTAVTGQLSYTVLTGTPVVFTGGTPVGSISPDDINALGRKQFMFMRTWFNHSGYYWNDGATCEDISKQLSSQEYNRVANIMSGNALSFFIDEMGKNLPLNKATGSVDQGYLNAKQQQFYDLYIAPLTTDAGTGDITDGSIIMTGPNFNATKTINFTLTIVPTPILGSVNGVVQFSSTL